MLGDVSILTPSINPLPPFHIPQKRFGKNLFDGSLRPIGKPKITRD